MIRSFILFTFLLFSFMLSGCLLVAGAGAGVGAMAYIDGELSQNLPYSFGKTRYATSKALRQIYGIKPSYKDSTFYTVNADGKKITVKLAPITVNATKVKIRVGTFGDKTQSRRIVSKIKALLR